MEKREGGRQICAVQRDVSSLPAGGAAPASLGAKNFAVAIVALCVALLTVFSAPLGADALSEIITGFDSPTFLEQLASFAAMRGVAEKEQLDWGAAAPHRPRAQTPPVVAAPPSRRRPHRRQHRRRKTRGASGDDGVDDSGSCGGRFSGSSADGGSGMFLTTSSSNSDVGSARRSCDTSLTVFEHVWSQLHMMSFFFGTQDNNLLHLTQRFIYYENMYPIVYYCNLRDVRAANEKALLDAPTTGLETSRFWSCRVCGKAHDVVRDSCLRCGRHAGPYTRLYFEQMLKETDGARNVLRLLHATHPEVAVHRVTTHPHVNGDGRVSVSVYVGVDAGPEVVTKLNGNVFFDTEGIGDAGDVPVYYVYSSQRRWLEAFIAARKLQNAPHTHTPPWAALVVLAESEERRSRHCGQRSHRPRKKRTDGQPIGDLF